MKTFLHSLLKAINYNSKGFTLIELLVVIGILGILASALIATVDPFEQLKKGRDTAIRNTSLEYLNAMTRYYASFGKFPWDNGITNCAAPTVASLLEAASILPCTTELIAQGELKKGFDVAVSGSDYDGAIKIYSPTNTSTLNICFSPQSKAIRSEPGSQYGQLCDAATGITACDTLGERRTAADDICWQVIR